MVVSSSAPLFRISDMRPQGSSLQQNFTTAPNDAASSKKKRNRAGTPKPDAEVIALSPQMLLATNRFVCEVCHKGFQRDQNLQLHLRGHNMPWKLKQRNPKEARRRVYLCPEPTCVHHNPSRALGDLTGIKKHYCRKHGEKNLKCDKCNKRYAVESDWKAHYKTCGTREYRCDCNTIFTRKDTFITHRATCEVAIRETNLPPLGTGLYVDSGSGSLRLSDGTAQIHGFGDLGQSSSAALEASQFDDVMPSYPTSSMFCSQLQDFSTSFFLGGGGAPLTEQDMPEGGGDHSNGNQDPLLHGKAPFHALMHLPEQQYQYQPSNSNANVNLPDFGFFSGNSGGASSSQGPLLHTKAPFHGHDLMQFQLPRQQHQPGSSNTSFNFPNFGFFSGNNNGVWSGTSQDARLLFQDQFNSSTSGSNTEHGNVMASIGSHFSGGSFIPSLYNSSASPSVGLSATALLMKAAQMGSTSSTIHNGPSALLRAAGFTGTVISGQGTSRAEEEGMSHEAHFHDLIINSLPLMGGTGTGGFSGTTAGMAGVDGGGNLSTRDFLGVDKDNATLPSGLHMGTLDPSQMKWNM